MWIASCISALTFFSTLSSIAQEAECWFQNQTIDLQLKKGIELSHLSESWTRNKDHTKWTKHGSQDSCKPSVAENLATARLIAETWIHHLLRGSFDPWQRKFFVTCESRVFLHQVCTCVFLELHKKSTYLAEWEDAKMDKLEFAAPSIATTPLSCLRSCCCWSSLLLGILLFCTHGNQKGTELQLHGVAFFLPEQPSLSLIGQENKRETRFPSVCTALAHHQTTLPNTCRLLQEKLFVVPANDDDNDDGGHDWCSKALIRNRKLQVPHTHPNFTEVKFARHETSDRW